MHHRAGTNQEWERVEHRNDDGHTEPSLFGTACNLNRHKAYSVPGSHGRFLRYTSKSPSHVESRYMVQLTSKPFPTLVWPSLPKTKVPISQPLKCSSIDSDHVRIDRFSGGNQPRVVLA